MEDRVSKSDRNRDDEWSILRRVYDFKKYPKEIIQYNGYNFPDFIVSHKEIFGVEVTQYFQDKTSDRINNDRIYRNAVYDNPDNVKKSRHGRMKDKLIPVVVSMDGSGFGMQAIFRGYLSPDKRWEKLHKIIESKSNKISRKHPKTLEDIDLIIYDAAGDLFGGEGGAKIWEYLKSLQETVVKPEPFRYIYVCKKFTFGDKGIIRLG